MDHFSVKVSHNGVIRRFSLPLDISYDALLDKLSEMFGVSRPFSVFYRDPDDDVVMLASGAELDELIRLVKQDGSQVVKITLQDKDSAPPQSGEGPHQQQSQKQQTSSAGAGPSSAPPPPLPDFSQLIAQMMPFLSSMGRGMGMGMGMSMGMGPCMGMGMGPFGLASFAPFLHQEMPAFSEDTKQAFRAAHEAVHAADVNHKAAFQAVHQLAPDLLGSIADALPEQPDAAITDDRIDAMCNQVRTSLQASSIAEGLVSAVVNLMRIALHDRAVVSMLRDVPLREMRTWIANMQCDVDDDMWTMFGEKMRAMGRHGHGHGRRDPFENLETKDGKAPPAPLMPGDQGQNVLLLQKTLTDLGYMNGAMYAHRAGLYGPHTKAAVEKFQKEFGLESATTAGVYDGTTAASLSSLVDSSLADCHRTAATDNAPAKQTTDGAGPSNVSA